MKPKKENVRIINKWEGYYMEDMQCRLCKYYRGKRGCKFEKCLYEDEKLDAIKNGRIKRERRLTSWDS